jgi:hypothetical protein
MQYDTWWYDMLVWYKSKKQKLKKERKPQTNVQEPKLPKLKREANSKLPSQASKLGLIKGFTEDVCELVVGVNMNKVNVPFLIVVS